MKSFLIILLILIHSCTYKNKSPEPARSTVTQEQGEQFWTFLERFTSDTNFQKARVGDSVMYSDTDYVKTQLLYARLKEMAVRTGPAKDTIFIGYSLTVSGDSVSERIFDDGGISSSERIFKRFQKKWYLVRYEKLEWY